MAFVGLPPPQSKTIDWLSQCSFSDPALRDPPVVYEMTNGRKFKEYPSSVVQGIYSSEDATSLYIPSGSVPGAVFYGTE